VSGARWAITQGLLRTTALWQYGACAPGACPLCTLPACCRPSPREPRRVHVPNAFPADSRLRPTTRGSATPLPALAALLAGSTLTGPRRSCTDVAACRVVSVPGRRTTPPVWWRLRARSSVRFDVPVARTRRDPDSGGVSGLSPGGLLASPKSRGFRLAPSSAKRVRKQWPCIRGWTSLTNHSSRTRCKNTLANMGEMTPPCGVPLSGDLSSPASSTPACSHLPSSLSLLPSLTLCWIPSRRWLQSRLSKNPLTSASTIQLICHVRHCSRSSCSA
jgi:hypothetical protein